MSHWFVRSFLALLLCCFGSLASSAPLIGEAGATTSIAGQQIGETATATPEAPGLPFGHRTDTTTPGLLDLADDTLKVHGDGAIDNVDLFDARARLNVLVSSPAAPEGWNGLSIQTPFLSKLRRPPRAELSL